MHRFVLMIAIGATTLVVTTRIVGSTDAQPLTRVAEAKLPR